MLTGVPKRFTIVPIKNKRPNFLRILCRTKVTGRLFPIVVFITMNTVYSFAPLVHRPCIVLFTTTTRLNVFTTTLLTSTFKFPFGRTTTVNVVNTTSNPAAVFITRGFTARLLTPLAIATFYCVSLIPVVRPPVVELLAAGHREHVHVTCGRRGPIS